VSQEAPEDVKVFRMGQCGAALVPREFPPFDLNANFGNYTRRTSIPNAHSFSLTPGGEPEVFEMKLFCRSPGTYVFNVKLAFTYQAKDGMLDLRPPSELVCPTSFTEYSLPSLDGAETFASVRKYVWNGDGYVEAP
jgi:hypothetical protein